MESQLSLEKKINGKSFFDHFLSYFKVSHPQNAHFHAQIQIFKSSKIKLPKHFLTKNCLGSLRLARKFISKYFLIILSALERYDQSY